MPFNDSIETTLVDNAGKRVHFSPYNYPSLYDAFPVLDSLKKTASRQSIYSLTLEKCKNNPKFTGIKKSEIKKLFKFYPLVYFGVLIPHSAAKKF